MSVGTSTLVRSLKTGEKPCEKYSVCDSQCMVRWKYCCTYLALSQLWLDCWPGLTLSSIAKQVHDDSAFANSLIHLEKVLSWDPAIPKCSLAFIYTIIKRFHTVRHLSMIVHSS